MAFFLTVLIVPFLVALVAFLLDRGFGWKQLCVQFVAQLAVAALAAGITSCANLHDVEVLNGRVTGKQREEVSCSHSYQCHCHDVCSGSGKDRSCHEECDTCYEHSYDVDWDVATTVGGYSIDRVDRQGLRQPQRWTNVSVGEPVTREHGYDSYIKAAPGTLFRYQGQLERYAATVPKYPQRVYDYWHDDRLVTVGIAVEEPRAWNADLQELNAELGAPKQANIIVVIAKDVSEDWFYALDQAWVGGKKNDVVLVVSVDGGMAPQWANVMAWTTNELFKVRLRDDVMAAGAVTRAGTIGILRQDVSQLFVRKPMHDFEYLKSEIVPTPTEWIVSTIVALVVALGLLFAFHEYDPFDERRSGC